MNLTRPLRRRKRVREYDSDLSMLLDRCVDEEMRAHDRGWRETERAFRLLRRELERRIP
jgi:hypothetical protein